MAHVSPQNWISPAGIAARAFAGVHPLTDLMALARRAFMAARAGIRQRTTAAQLHRLDDHLLRDIGIDRHEIDAVAAGRARAEYYLF